jgi:acyl-CoA oxidase
MTRQERLKNALKLMHRLHELQDQHGWSDIEFKKAHEVMAESSGYDLHFIGDAYICSLYYVIC